LTKNIQLHWVVGLTSM